MSSVARLGNAPSIETPVKREGRAPIAMSGDEELLAAVIGALSTALLA
jgi:hypothetical protein